MENFQEKGKNLFVKNFLLCGKFLLSSETFFVDKRSCLGESSLTVEKFID